MSGTSSGQTSTERGTLFLGDIDANNPWNEHKSKICIVSRKSVAPSDHPNLVVWLGGVLLSASKKTNEDGVCACPPLWKTRAREQSAAYRRFEKSSSRSPRYAYVSLDACYDRDEPCFLLASSRKDLHTSPKRFCCEEIKSVTRYEIPWPKHTLKLISSQGRKSDDFWLRSPIVQKTVQPTRVSQTADKIPPVSGCSRSSMLWYAKFTTSHARNNNCPDRLKYKQHTYVGYTRTTHHPARFCNAPVTRTSLYTMMRPTRYWYMYQYIYIYITFCWSTMQFLLFTGADMIC